jgi:hypothetical protein
MPRIPTNPHESSATEPRSPRKTKIPRLQVEPTHSRFHYRAKFAEHPLRKYVVG